MQTPQQPFIVRIIQPDKDTTGLGALRDVMVGSIGLTGAIILLAIVAGGVLAGVLFWVRSRSG